MYMKTVVMMLSNNL